MRLSRAAIDVAAAALALGSSAPPSQASVSTMRARRDGEFSPIPAVNTKASSPPRSAAAIQQVLNLCGGHVFFLDEVKDDAGIDLPWPCPHRQAVERSKAHRALDAAAACKRAHRCTAAQMGNDHAPGGNLWRHLRQPAGNVFVGEAVEPVAAHTLRIEALRDGVVVRKCVVATVKGGVEAGDLRKVGEAGEKRADWGEV